MSDTTGSTSGDSSSSSATATTSTSGPGVGYLKREEILGKSVVTMDGMIIGSVRDLAVSLDGKAALQVVAKESAQEPDGPREIFVYSEDIQAVGDVILLRYTSNKGKIQQAGPAAIGTTPSTSVVAPPPYPGAPAPGRTCPRCHFVNTGSSRFCIKCGAPL